MEVKFIKIFDTEAEATAFAELHNTQVIVRYDWNAMLRTIVHQYEVKF